MSIWNTELGFLLDLLLNYKLPGGAKKAVTERMKEVEQALSQRALQSPVQPSYMPPVVRPPASGAQAASTQALLEKHGLAVPPVATPEGAPLEPVLPMVPMSPAVAPASIAQTPAAQAALNARRQLISQAVTGREEKGRSGPRKF